jgi:hypothetical protein
MADDDTRSTDTAAGEALAASPPLAVPKGDGSLGIGSLKGDPSHE